MTLLKLKSSSCVIQNTFVIPNSHFPFRYVCYLLVSVTSQNRSCIYFIIHISNGPSWTILNTVCVNLHNETQPLLNPGSGLRYT